MYYSHETHMRNSNGKYDSCFTGKTFFAVYAAIYTFVFGIEEF
jgi:hypothetical protein